MGQVFPITLTHTAGVNSDGSSRQEEIARSTVGEAVSFFRDDSNPTQMHKVLVKSARGVVIGAVGDDAKWMARALANRQDITGTITAIADTSDGTPTVTVEGVLAKKAMSGAAKGVLIAVGGCIALVFAIAIGGMIYGEINPEWKAQVEKEAADRREHDRVEAERATVAAAAASSAETARNAQKEKFAVQTVWNGIIQANSMCERYSQNALRLITSPNPSPTDILNAYDAARQGEGLCRDKSDRISGLAIPDGVSGATETKLQDAKRVCADLQVTRQNLMKQLAEMINGGVTVAAMSDLRRTTGEAQTAQLQCLAGMAVAGEAVGLTMDDLQKAM